MAACSTDGEFTPVAVAPGASRHLAQALVLIHGAAAAALLVSPVPAGVRWLLLAGVLLAALRAWREHVAHRGDAIVRVAIGPSHRWLVTTRMRPAMPARLRPGNLVAPWLTVLAFELEDGRRRSVLILPDNVPARDFRRLRALVRHGG